MSKDAGQLKDDLDRSDTPTVLLKRMSQGLMIIAMLVSTLIALAVGGVFFMRL